MPLEAIWIVIIIGIEEGQPVPRRPLHTRIARNRHTGIGLIAEDINFAYEEMRAAGVEFEMSPTKQPWGGVLALFKDPDGNVFYLDEIPEDVLAYEGARYFANIILLYSPLVLKLLKRVGELNLSPKVIAPDHGPIWRKDIGKIIAYYQEWATQKPKDKAVVIYDTMWGSTEKMAKAIVEGLTAGGTHCKLLSLRESHRSDVATEILDAGALLVGSPTINNGIFPTLADVLTYLKGLKPQNLIGAAFGSYGWSGEAVGQLEELLTGMKLNLVQEGLKVQYVPNSDNLLKCRASGLAVSRHLKDILSE